MADVKWTFFADTAAAERTIQQLEQKYAKLENAVAQVGRKSKSGSSEVLAGLKAQLVGVGSLITGFASLGNVLSMAHAEAQRLFKATDDAANRTDVAVRKLRILGNLNAMEGDRAKDSITATAVKLGFSRDEGMEAARELTSAGFDVKQAIGPALESLLKSLAANQEFGKDINTGDLARASASYLQSQGQELTGANLERIGIFVKKLADVSTVGIADLQEIAKHGATMAGKLTQEEQFAAVTALRKEGRPGSEAANALEKVVLSLTGKGDKRKTTEALEELGLKGTDVDMIGESFLDSLKKLDSGLKDVAPERQDTILTKLFGVEHISAAKSLITKNAYVAELTAGQNDRAGFDTAVGIATSGRAAGGRRLSALEEAQIEGKADKYSEEDVKTALRMAMREAGSIPLDVGLAQSAYSANRSLGFSQETSIALTPGTGGIPGIYQGDVQKRITQLLEQSVQEQQKQTAILQGAAKGSKSPNRNAHTEGGK